MLFKRYRSLDKSKNNFSFTIGNQHLIYLNPLDTAIRVEPYTPSHKGVWNQFVRQAKNATFLFERDFMDYHAHRFTDASLIVFKKNKIVAVMPANVKDEVVYSHQGLSYGGLLLSEKIKLAEASSAFKAVLHHLHDRGISTLSLKVLPKIYQKCPADEIDYLLFLTEATRTRVDVSATIAMAHPLKIQANRMEGVKKAEKQGLQIAQTTDFSSFWNTILIPNLEKRHGAKPVHSLDEITTLAKMFPKHIKQYNVLKEDAIVAGATMFVTKRVAHVQYISANEDKQQLGSLDFLFHYLITSAFVDMTYFDFGISNENNGKNVNYGLQYWKECFGARSSSQEFYEIPTANYSALDSVFI